MSKSYLQPKQNVPMYSKLMVSNLRQAIFKSQLDAPISTERYFRKNLIYVVVIIIFNFVSPQAFPWYCCPRI